jgi:hypothetical protein
MDGGGEGGSSGGRFPILQANRDPESNWEVDVAKSLEDYLLKICSGEVSGEDGAHSVNFAEGTVVRRTRVSCGQRAALLFSGCAILGVWRAGNWEWEVKNLTLRVV